MWDKYLDKLIDEDYARRYAPANPRLEYLEDLSATCYDMIDSAERFEDECKAQVDYYGITTAISNVLYELYKLRRALNDEIELAKEEEGQWD